MPEVEPVAFAGGEAVVFSARAPDKETANEDAAALLAVDGDRGVLAVADGMGGLPGGESAALLVLRTLAEAVARAEPDEETLRGPILDALERANDEVRAMGAGATLVVGELAGGWVRPYHVGDAEILVVGQRGRLKLRTLAHSPVAYAVHAGLLDVEEALHHEERHIVSNALGTPDMRIEVGSPLHLAPRDTLLLASDGLFDNLHVPEIVDLVRKGPLEGAAAALRTRCRARMAGDGDAPSKPDDLTFVLYRLGARRG